MYIYAWDDFEIWKDVPFLIKSVRLPWIFLVSPIMFSFTIIIYIYFYNPDPMFKKLTASIWQLWIYNNHILTHEMALLLKK